MSTRILLASLLIAVWPLPSQAQETFYFKPLRELEITKGELPAHFSREDANFYYWQSSLGTALAYARLEGDGEIYLVLQDDARDERFRAPYVAIRTPSPRKLSGRLFLPQEYSDELTSVHFSIPAEVGDSDQRSAFNRAKWGHYVRLQEANLPGNAWFQQQSTLALQDLSKEIPRNRARNLDVDRDDSQLRNTFDLLSGGRAISENLQLDRALPTTPQADAAVDVTTLQGITVEEFDWHPHIEYIRPKLDPLARQIPFDQHAVFFPSLSDMEQVLHETMRGVAPVFAATPQTEQALANDFYPRQLCLPLNGGSEELVGLVKSVAVTGGDPYFALGTDVAVLLESDHPEQLADWLRAYVALMGKQTPGLQEIQGTIGELSYTGVHLPDRSICCYLAQLEHGVVITNSQQQLKRLHAVDEKTSLATLPEYRFFRDRYPIDQPETALLVITDATIRRWCGPRCRIGHSRRLRAAAVMANLQAKHLDALVSNTVDARDIEPAFWLPGESQFQLTPAGVSSDVYGNLHFVTPVNELQMEKVTDREAQLYQSWRDSYQQNWSSFFDPIAVQFHLQPTKVAADVTVMPLIEGTEYRALLNLMRGVKLEATDGDPHIKALLQVAVSLNTESFDLKEFSYEEMGTNLNIFKWLGNYATVYVDQSPFWDEFANAEEPLQFLEDNYFRIPIALEVGLRDSMVASALVTALRAASQQAAPGMMDWVTKEHQKRPYVMVAPSPLAQRGNSWGDRGLRIFYALSGESFVISPNEDVLKQSLERQEARHEGRPTEDRSWLGENLNVYADSSVLDFVTIMENGGHQQLMQRSAWQAIPILNAWKQRYPSQDPAQLYSRFWGMQLSSPPGKGYRWNEEWQTMESVVYGHPGDPRVGPTLPEMYSEYNYVNFGLTFEKDGVRARMELGRTPVQVETEVEASITRL